MSKLISFQGSRAASVQVTYSAVAALVAVGSLGLAYYLDNQIKTGGMALAQTLKMLPNQSQSKVASLRQVTVDYTPTGSIPNNLLLNHITLDPCTGQQKK